MARADERALLGLDKHVTGARAAVVTHELTHVISHNVIANQPAWFAEGMAGFFETVRLDERRSTIELGAPLQGRFAQIAPCIRAWGSSRSLPSDSHDTTSLRRPSARLDSAST